MYFSHFSSENDKVDIEASSKTQGEWLQSQQRYQDFVDYDAMDLIELSELADDSTGSSVYPE